MYFIITHGSRGIATSTYMYSSNTMVETSEQRDTFGSCSNAAETESSDHEAVLVLWFQFTWAEGGTGGEPDWLI